MGKLARIGGLALLALATGCGRDTAPREAVRGRVLFHGAPLPGGTIVFTPDAERSGQGPLARGVIRSDGSYDLASGPDQGAVAGWHRVTVAPASSSALAWPAKYTDPERSGQVCEVKTGQVNTIDFHLE
jgi:hypothetical protein